MRRGILSCLVVFLVACGSEGRPADRDAGSPAPPPSPTEPPSHDISGTFTLQGIETYRVLGFDPFEDDPVQEGHPCEGDEGYDDIASGTQVVVRDGSGSVLASGRLDPGELVLIAPDVPDLFDCEFSFVVSDVPETDFYGVEVSHRGELTYSLAEMEQADWHVSLTLG